MREYRFAVATARRHLPAPRHRGAGPPHRLVAGLPRLAALQRHGLPAHARRHPLRARPPAGGADGDRPHRGAGGRRLPRPARARPARAGAAGRGAGGRAGVAGRPHRGLQAAAHRLGQPPRHLDGLLLAGHLPGPPAAPRRGVGAARRARPGGAGRGRRLPPDRAGGAGAPHRLGAGLRHRPRPLRRGGLAGLGAGPGPHAAPAARLPGGGAGAWPRRCGPGASPPTDRPCGAGWRCWPRRWRPRR